jgi:glycerophosphoryl diester phosphodiesterase
MKILHDVLASYRVSLQVLVSFTLIHLGVRLLAAAVIVPVSGVILASALAASGQNVVTDQEIARFLLTPAGFAGALALISLSIVASVLDVAVMTHALGRQERSATARQSRDWGSFSGGSPACSALRRNWSCASC